MCILIVEDEPLIRLLVAEEFIDAGFDVREAETGDIAIALIQEPPLQFTLLVTDIHMPGQHDGIAVARMLRQLNPQVPVIYTTGRPDALNSVGSLGANEVLITKPFVPSQLLREAHRLLGHQGH